MNPVWINVLAIIVSFCAGTPDPGVCRHQRIQCIKNGATFGGEAVDLIDACLQKPDLFPEPKATATPAPKVTPSPTVSILPKTKKSKAP